MAVPEFLNSSHYYTEITGVDDVQDIIDALGTILKTTNSPVWTEPVGGTFVSPVDGDGRYFQVAVSRVDQDTLQLVVTDQYSTAICTKRIDINASGSPTCAVKIYSGQYHLWIDTILATLENFRSGLLDLSPSAQTDWNTIVYGAAHRNSSGTATSNQNNVLSISGVADSQELVVFPITYSNYAPTVDPVGNNVFWPVFVRNGSGSGGKLGGRMYQALIGSTGIAYGAEVTVPIDSGVTAKFRAAGASPYNSGAYSRLLIRAD